MKTKNNFFAEYFINELENLIRQIEEFGNGDQSLFGKETDEDLIHSTLSDIVDQWENCVNLKAEEGYPVIDIWHEELELLKKEKN